MHLGWGGAATVNTFLCSSGNISLPATGPKAPLLWPSSAPQLRDSAGTNSPLSTPVNYTISWETSGAQIQHQTGDNTFVECEITTMRCGNITQGLRQKPERLKLNAVQHCRDCCGTCTFSYMRTLCWYVHRLYDFLFGSFQDQTVSSATDVAACSGSSSGVSSPTLLAATSPQESASLLRCHAAGGKPAFQPRNKV